MSGGAACMRGSCRMMLGVGRGVGPTVVWWWWWWCWWKPEARCWYAERCCSAKSWASSSYKPSNLSRRQRCSLHFKMVSKGSGCKKDRTADLCKKHRVDFRVPKTSHACGQVVTIKTREREHCGPVPYQPQELAVGVKHHE